MSEHSALTKTKPPTLPRRVFADDLSVVVGGEIYYPHAGEWVEFKGRPSVGLYVKLMDITSASKESLKELHKYIVAWDWTDDAGQPYVNPPTLETLLDMPPEELKWLLVNAGSDAALPTKNGGTPSIAH
jgi:hypothetical protein